MRIYRSDDGKAAMIGLDHGGDLYEQLAAGVRDLGLRAGTVQVIGAVSGLTLAYYDQDAREYRNLDFPGHWEIASGIGNVSVRDHQPFVHVHVVASAEDGRAVGGHLVPGCRVFAAEAYVRDLGGEAPIRREDEVTGLAVWG